LRKLCFARFADPVVNEKALSIYGAGENGKNPVKDKQKLIADLRKAVDAATTFCAARRVILPAIEQLTASGRERLQRIDDAVNALISPTRSKDLLARRE